MITTTDKLTWLSSKKAELLKGRYKVNHVVQSELDIIEAIEKDVKPHETRFDVERIRRFSAKKETSISETINGILDVCGVDRKH